MQHGSIAFYLLLIGIIIAAVYLADGLTPKAPFSPALHPYANPTQAAAATAHAAAEPLYAAANIARTTPTIQHGGQTAQILFNGVHQPTVSTPPASCFKHLAIDFLIDNATSMNQDLLGQSGNNTVTKLTKLKQNLIAFAQEFSDTTIVGMQSFSGPPTQITYANRIYPSRTAKIEVPITSYHVAKSIFSPAVTGMKANGQRYTRDAFSFTKSILDGVIPSYPQQKFALVFISDGMPEVIPPNLRGNCELINDRCFATNQDPTTFPDITSSLKAEGVRIFTVAYLNQSDTFFNTLQQTLMTRIASSPSDAFIAPSNMDVKNLFDQVAAQLCQ